ncbi:RmlC-like cupin [Cutaneotrichosporon oleaginosum]|uniref:RmlC-like cupin n=1 Tax=Cutaneotrichosporon oleaginosum TaxID=879819 RepID=A0A0J1B9P7_9TREE|nr:RmlC-like cupin [Cutaneotrichosporon oleaginosum]KLT44574.1 RmlC-like cupin [Cutaneotrichosporon oleaginosum]TXT13912.1 hypothetical protein COLE_00105 [Cutaneotrichosporon oleaginosum]
MSSPISSTPPQSSTSKARSAGKVVAAFDTAEGVGAKVLRSIGTPALWNLSPFLILDHARVGQGAGFPDHPHRGMATVTYVLEGMMQHEDFMGNYGRLSQGDVQWMTAGRGVVHAEMPLVDPEHPMDAVALQLWLDLPAAKKMVKPSYKEKKAESLARATFEGGSVVVVSGESHGAVGPIRPIAGCWFLDYRLDAGGQAWQPIPAGWTAFVYVLDGVVAVGGTAGGDETGSKEVGSQHVCVLSASAGEEGVCLRSRSKKGSRFVLVAGEPLDQPMVLQGPFVSTSRDGAAQALRDYQNGRNGFEKALGWRSDIGKDVGMVRRKPRRKGEEDWEERDPREKSRRGDRREAKYEGEAGEPAGADAKAKGGGGGRGGGRSQRRQKLR